MPFLVVTGATPHMVFSTPDFARIWMKFCRVKNYRLEEIPTELVQQFLEPGKNLAYWDDLAQIYSEVIHYQRSSPD